MALNDADDPSLRTTALAQRIYPTVYGATDGHDECSSILTFGYESVGVIFRKAANLYFSRIGISRKQPFISLASKTVDTSKGSGHF